jgi:hypothetical protein
MNGITGRRRTGALVAGTAIGLTIAIGGLGLDAVNHRSSPSLAALDQRLHGAATTGSARETDAPDQALAAAEPTSPAPSVRRTSPRKRAPADIAPVTGQPFVELATASDRSDMLATCGAGACDGIASDRPALAAARSEDPLRIMVGHAEGGTAVLMADASVKRIDSVYYLDGTM